MNDKKVMCEAESETLQIFYLDIDGALTDYHGTYLTIDDVEVQESFLSPERIAAITAQLNEKYAGRQILFVSEKPEKGLYSTIFIGETDAFASYGDFSGIAESVDSGNKVKDDNAFVLLDADDDDEAIIEAVSHECAHLLGELDHGGEGLLKYALSRDGFHLIAEEEYLHHLYVSPKQTAEAGYNALINSGYVQGNMTVNVMASVRNFIVAEKGVMSVTAGGSAWKPKVEGTLSVDGSDFSMDLPGGAKVSLANVAKNGFMEVIELGSALDTSLFGTLEVGKNGYVSGTAISDGGLMTVKADGLARGTVCFYNGNMLVSAGGTAEFVHIYNGASATVFKDGSVASALLDNGGTMYISSGGGAADVRVLSGGVMIAEKNAVFTGAQDYAGTVTVKDVVNGANADVTFVVRGSEAMWTDQKPILSSERKFNARSYAVSVSADQCAGLYALAGDASGFNESVTVKVGEKSMGTLTIGGTAVVLGNTSYELALVANNVLTLVVENISEGSPYPADKIILAGDAVKVYKGEELVRQGDYIGGELLSRDGNDAMSVSAGGIAEGTVISYGEAEVLEGGSIVNTTVNGGGELTVSAGGWAADIVVEDGGYASFEEGADINDVTVGKNGELWTDKTYIENLCVEDFLPSDFSNGMVNGFYGDIAIHGDFHLKDVQAGSYAVVYAGQKATGVFSDVELVVYGNVYDLESFGVVSVEQYGVVDGAYFGGTTFHVSEDAQVRNVYVGSDSEMIVNEGGRALNIDVGSYGKLTLEGGASVGGFQKWAGEITINGYVDAWAADIILCLGARDPDDAAIINNLNEFYANSYTIQVGDTQRSGVYTIAEKVTTDSFAYEVTLDNGRHQRLLYSYDELYLDGKAYSMDHDWESERWTFSVRDYSSITDEEGFSVFILKDDEIVWRGSIAADKVLNADGNDEMRIRLGGAAFRTDVQNGAVINVEALGFAANTTVKQGGTANILGETYNMDGIYYAGQGRAEYLTVQNGGTAEIGGIVSYLTVAAGGKASLTCTTEFNMTYIEMPEDMLPYDYDEPEIWEINGSAEDVTIAYGGSFTVDAGGILIGAQTYAGTVTLLGKVDAAAANVTFDLEDRSSSDDAIVNNLSYLDALTYSITISADQAEGVYKLADNAAAFSDTFTIGYGFTSVAEDLAVGEYAVYDGMKYALSLSGTTLNLTISEAIDPVPPDKCKKELVEVFSNDLLVSSAALIKDKTLYGWDESLMHVHKGGTAQNNTVGNGAQMLVSSGGYALENIVDNGTMEIYHSGSAFKTTVENGEMSVFTGGSAVSSYIETNGLLTVAAGGLVSSSTVKGEMAVAGGKAVSSLILENGVLYASDGGIVQDTKVMDGGFLEIDGNALAENTDIAGTLTVFEGRAVENHILVDALLEAYDGAVLSNTYISANGTLELYNGAKHTGLLANSAENNRVIAEDGSVIDFDLSSLTPTEWARVYDLGAIEGAPTFTVTVSNDQSSGRYALAWGAESFNGSMTLFCDGAALGELVYNTSLVVGDKEYLLHGSEVVEENLYLTVSDYEPDNEAPVITVNSVKQLEGMDNYTFEFVWDAVDNVSSKEDLSVAFYYAPTEAMLEQAAPSQKSFTLTPGDAAKTFWYQISVSDEAGNTRDVKGTFTVEDRTAPVMGSDPLIASVNLKRELAVVWGQATDNVGVVRYILSRGDQVIADDITNNSYIITDPEPGDLELTVVAVDAQGNQSAPLTQRFSPVPERADLVIESIKFLLNGQEVTTLYDDKVYDMVITVANVGGFNTAVTDMKVNYSIAGASPQQTMLSLTTVRPGETREAVWKGLQFETGSLEVTAYADFSDIVIEGNNENNSKTASFTVLLGDTIPPEITEFAITQQSGEDNYTFSSTFTASDNSQQELTDVKYFYAFSEAELDQLIAAGTGGAKTFTVKAEDAGKELWGAVRVADNNGNASVRKDHKVIADRTAPELDHIRSSLDAVGALTISWNPATDNVGVVNYILKLDGAEFGAPIAADKYSVTIPGLAGGTHSFSLVAVDAAGYRSEERFGSVEITETGFNEPPYIDVSSYQLVQADGQYLFTYHITASDDTTPADELSYRYYYSFDPQTIFDGEGFENNSFTLQPEAYHEYIFHGVEVTDKNGKTSALSGHLKVADYTPPVLTGNVNIREENGQIIFSWNKASDNHKVLNYLLTVNGRELPVYGESMTLNASENGTYSCSVVAVDYSGNKSNAITGEFNSSRTLPDLVIDSVSFVQDGRNVSSVDIDKEFVCEIRLRNIGTAASIPCTGGIWWGEIFEEFSIAAGIDPGEAVIFRKTMKPEQFTTGNHEVRVDLDIRDSVEELNENNNSRKVVLNASSGSLCDLVVSGLTLDPAGTAGAVIDPKKDFKIYFKITNNGAASAPGSTAWISYNDQSGNMVRIGECQVPSLAAGAAGGWIEFTVPAGTLPDGIAGTKLYVTANGDGAVSEVSSRNNQASMELYLGTVSDIEVSLAYLDKQQVSDNETVTVYADIYNCSPIASGEFSVSVLVDGKEIAASEKIGPLGGNSGKMASISFNSGLLGTGSHTLTVYADLRQENNENFRDNNVFTSAELVLAVEDSQDTPPEILTNRITQEENGYTFTVTATAKDDTEGLVYEYRYGLSSEELLSKNFTSQNTVTLAPEYAEKPLFWQVRVIDQAMHTVTSQIRFVTVLDKTAPVIKADAVSVSKTGNSLHLAWGNAVSDNVGIAGVNIYIDGVQKASGFTGSEMRFNNLSSGEHFWTIEVVDTAGLKASTGNIRVNFDDNEKPVFNDDLSFCQIEGTYQFRYLGTASDNMTAAENLIYKVQYALDDVSFNASRPMYELDDSRVFTLSETAADHQLAVWLWVFDESGNAQNSMARVVSVIDYTPPSTVTGLSADVDGQRAALTWDPAADNSGKISGYRIRISTDPDALSGMSVQASEFSPDTQFDFSAAAPGTYYWQVAALDRRNTGEWSEVQSFTVFPVDICEKNNSVEEAFDLGILNQELSIGSTNLDSSSDIDWFKFSLTTLGKSGDFLAVEQMPGSSGDVTVELYAADGKKLLASAGSKGGRAELSLANVARGDYYARIFSPDGSRMIYELTGFKNNGVAPDVYEESNDTIAGATNILLENQISGSLDMTIDQYFGADVDYIRIDLDSAGSTNDYVMIKFDNSLGNLDLFLCDKNGNTVLSSAGNGNSESIPLGGIAPGTWYIKVAGASPDIQNSYTFSWSINPATAEADDREGSEPIQLTDGRKLDLSISPDSETSDRKDTFNFTISKGSSSQNSIVLSGLTGDWGSRGLSYTITGENLTSPLTGRSNGTIRLNRLKEGDYTLVLDTPAEGVYGEYSITANLAEKEGVSKKQAILLYVGADNNGHNRYLYDLALLQNMVLAEGVELYVLLDRSDDPEYRADYDFGFDDWSGTKFCKLEYRPGVNDPAAQAWQDWGELNSGSVDTLARFINTAMGMSKADQYTLVIHNHGGRSGSISSDHTNNSIMQISDIAALLKNYTNIPVVAFDACSLGSDHVLAQMNGACDYLIASEAVSYSLGVNMRFPDAVAAINRNSTAEEIARILISTAHSGTENVRLEIPFFRDGRLITHIYNSPHTLAAYNVSGTALYDALNTFAVYSTSFSESEWQILASAFAQAENYGSMYSNISVCYSDLQWIVSTALGSSSGTLEVALCELTADLEEVVISQIAVPYDHGSSFAVFNPMLSSEQGVNVYQNSLVEKGLESWGEFLVKLTDYADDSISVAAAFGSEGFYTRLAGNADSDLGFFYGSGIEFRDLSLKDGAAIYFTFDSLSAFAEGEMIRCTPENTDCRVTLSVYNQEMELLKQGENGVLALNDVADPEGVYILKVESEGETEAALEFISETLYGVDRFDYAETHSLRSSANGNGTIEKATVLRDGSYSGLLTRAGDSDYYAVAASEDSRCFIRVTGDEGLRVEALDSKGNLLKQAEYLYGEYVLTMPESGYLRIEGDADLEAGEVNSYALQVAVITADSMTLGLGSGLSWNYMGTMGSYDVEISREDGSRLLLTAENNALDLFGLPGGEYTWRASAENGHYSGSTFVNENAEEGAQFFKSDPDGNTDLFFARSIGVWENSYFAEHQGALNLWSGTGEKVDLAGKNKIGDVFEGSVDASILVLSDSANGDALFLDDIFTALPSSLLEQQERIDRIRQIRAGAGNDIIDMTSQRFASSGGIVVYGGAGNDTIWAGTGEYILCGDGGNDRLVGGADNDILVGGAGNDSMHGGGGDDIFTFGGAFGCDTIEQLSDGTVTLWFEEGTQYSWDEFALVCTVDENSVAISGITADRVSIKIGGEAPTYGAFADAVSENIFEKENTEFLA